MEDVATGSQQSPHRLTSEVRDGPSWLGQQFSRLRTDTVRGLLRSVTHGDISQGQKQKVDMGG